MQCTRHKYTKSKPDISSQIARLKLQHYPECQHSPDHDTPLIVIIHPNNNQKHDIQQNHDQNHRSEHTSIRNSLQKHINNRKPSRIGTASSGGHFHSSSMTVDTSSVVISMVPVTATP